jgi:hypothetical protein
MLPPKSLSVTGTLVKYEVEGDIEQNDNAFAPPNAFDPAVQHTLDTCTLAVNVFVVVAIANGVASVAKNTPTTATNKPIRTTA